MPRFIIRMERDGEVRYAEWSTIVDAPVSLLLLRKDFYAYIAAEYGREGTRTLAQRLALADERGTSSYLYKNIDEVFVLNRAGDREKRLTADEIWHKYRS